MKNSFLKTVLIFFALCSALSVLAQDTVTLSIGDPAPPLKYSKWIQGTPVTSYQNDRLYIVEFWATWCGPCIAAMPHLSELSEKYKDQATFIGANVWERTGDKPYESALPRLINFVKSKDNKMTYNVIADNNDHDLVNLWLKPAGILGIPTTFVVEKGKLVWIGHPIKVDSIINLILAGTFDEAAFKKEYEAKQSDTSNFQNKYRIAADKIKAAVDAKDFDKAFLMIDESIKQIPMLELPLRVEKFNILLKNFPEKKTLDYAKELIKENKSFALVIASAIAEKDGLSKEAYLFAAENLQAGLKEYSFSANLDKLALAYSKAGDLQSAVSNEEKAIAAAKQEVKDGKFKGYVFDFTIKDYEKTLSGYKKALKN
jgi:thiol-disulfide isomerase/thioredoxin